MLNSKPFFSILMPTYNRASLLRFAVRSVLQQTFDNFELVISNGGSTDNTREVVSAFDDRRIRYVESKERLNIGDNYQNALNNATGEYITFLSDDDAFAPVMLERVKRVIDEHNAEVVAFQFAHFYHDDCVDDEGRKVPANTLAVQPFTGHLSKFDKATAIQFIFGIHGLNKTEPDKGFIIPYLANAVYKSDVFARITSVREKPFACTPADMYLAAAVFFTIDHYYCLDEPLHVWSQWSDNATASPQKKGNKLREHYERLLNGETLRFTPLKFALPFNCGVNAILQARSDFQDRSEIDWSHYYFKTYENLMYLKNSSVDISAELDDFHDVLSKEPKELSSEVYRAINNLSFVIKSAVRSFPAALSIAKKVLRRRHRGQPIIISGKANRFGDVLECATFIAAIHSKCQNSRKAP